MPAKYLLDSDICIVAVCEKHESLMEMVRSIRSDGIALSVISYGEVTDGVFHSKARERDLGVWRAFLEGVDVIDVAVPIADIWAEMRGALRLAGNRVPDNDLLIAVTAMRFDMVVVSKNLRDFGRVAGLNLLVP